jgi:transposase
MCPGGWLRCTPKFAPSSAGTGIDEHRSGSVILFFWETSMTGKLNWFAFVDWGSRSHQVAVVDAGGDIKGEKSFSHDGKGLSEMAQWLLKTTGAEAKDIDVGIEVPHGPVVESLMEKGFVLFAINPKQIDRFRDRFSPAGAKDDRRDALVGADALRTDKKAFEPLSPEDPVIIKLREWSRIAEELKDERVALTNRIRDQFWRYFPQMIDIGDDLAADWFVALFALVPTPEKARRVNKATLETFLKRHRVRRFDTQELMERLQAPALKVSAATTQAASEHIKILMRQISLLNRQIAGAKRQLDKLTDELGANKGDDADGQSREQRDVLILRSLPGLGRTNVATLLAEAHEPLRRRDYQVLRCLTGAAPVTKQSGKTKFVVRRTAVNSRLRNALYHWARVAIQHDPRSRAKYAALRQRGKGHARSLRAVGDRLLAITCILLERGTLYDPARA